MKYIFLFFYCVNVAFAWEMQENNGQVYLRDTRYNMNEKISALSGDTKKEMIIKELNKELTLITYLANVGGTKEVSYTYNCSLYSKKLKKLIFKDNICKTISKNIKKNATDVSSEVTEASFVIHSNEIIYKYEELVEKYAE